MEVVFNLLRRHSSILKVTLARGFLLRTFTMTSRRLEKAADDLKSNPYYEKYASKIATLQETSPEEFLSRIEQREQEKMKRSDAAAAKERQYSALLHPKKEASGSTEQQKEQLDKIMKVDQVKDKPAEEIKSIWEQYHMHKEDTIAATIPAKYFDTLNNRAQQFPVFLFPLPRSQGYEFIMCQFDGNSVHFTPLLYYQVHKENAPECLTIVHYTEFKDSKGIVLMRGEYDKNILDAKEAQCLANQLQLYYSQDDPKKLKLLEKFTKKPEDFKHMDLVKEIENLSL